MSELDRLNKDNRSTYQGFLGLTKWGVVFVVVVLAALAFFLV